MSRRAAYGVAVLAALAAVAYVGWRWTQGPRALLTAAAEGNAAAVRSLLGRGVVADSPGEGGLTPLGAATINGHTEVAKLLLERGASVEGTRGEQYLGSAVTNCRAGILRLLLQKGVNPRAAVAPREDGKAPLSSAIAKQKNPGLERECAETLRLLERAGVSEQSKGESASSR